MAIDDKSDHMTGKGFAMSENNKDEEYVDVYSVLKNFESGSNEPVRSSAPRREPDAQKAPEMPRYHEPEVKSSNGGKKVLAIALCCAILLIGCIGLAALTGAFGQGGSPVATESSQESFYTVKTSSVTSVEEESSKEPELTFEPTGEFKFDETVLPKNVKETLDGQILAKYVLLYDVNADKVLYQKKGKEKCYPASTTKMLTAIVGAKIIPPETVITVGDEIKLINWDSSTAGHVKGMKLTFESLMDGLMLPSGNDAAYTIAVNAAKIYTGNNDLSDEEAVKIFMELVNKAAKEIGCSGTHYVTPDGWHDDDHYTCAEDLAKIAAYARTVPLVKNSVCKYEAEWDVIEYEPSEESSVSQSSTEESSKNESGSSEAASTVSEEESSGEAEGSEDESEEEFVYKPETLYWTNSNRMLNPDAPQYSKFCDGVKTGYTDEAGTSVVCSATVDGHTMIAVIMFGYTMYTKYDDANRLFKQGFAAYGLDYTYSNEGSEADVGF